MKTAREAREVIANCDEQECDRGVSRYRSLSYEEGVRDALAWAFGSQLALDEPDEWPFGDSE